MKYKIIYKLLDRYVVEIWKTSSLYHDDNSKTITYRRNMTYNSKIY